MRRHLLLAALAIVGAASIALGARSGAAHAASAPSATATGTVTGTSYTVNVGPPDETDPHVSGDWVSYSQSDGTTFTVRYHNLVTGVDAQVPTNDSLDFGSDVSGTTIVFTRVSSDRSAIYSYTIGDSVAVEVAPQAGSIRRSPHIGGSTVAWQDFGYFSSAGNSDIVVYDLNTQVLTRLTSDGQLNQWPALSPAGTVVTWAKCVTVDAPCDIWDATLNSGSWTLHQLTDAQGNCSHPDTSGGIVVYTCDRGSGDQLFWQPAAGGTEQQVGLPGNEESPSTDGNLIAFSYLAPGATAHQIWVYDIVHDVAYPVSNTPSDDAQLNAISVSSSGTANVVWQVQQANESMYGFGFTSPALDTTAPVLTLPGPLTVDATSPTGAAVSYTVTATDPDNPASSLTMSCTLPSGSTFPIGTNTVNCNAADPAGNTTPGSFTVTVLGAADQLGALIGSVQSLDLKQGITTSLDAKLQSVQAALTAANAGNRANACNALSAFVNEVQAQSGNALTVAEATQLIAAAQQIERVMGC